MQCAHVNFCTVNLSSVIISNMNIIVFLLSYRSAGPGNDRPPPPKNVTARALDYTQSLGRLLLLVYTEFNFASLVLGYFYS